MKKFFTLITTTDAPLQASEVLRDQTFEELFEVLGKFIRGPSYEGMIISQGPKSTNLTLTKQKSLVRVGVVDRSLSDETIRSFKNVTGSTNFKLREKKTKYGIKYLDFQILKTVDALSDLIKTGYQTNTSSNNFVIKIYRTKNGNAHE